MHKPTSLIVAASLIVAFGLGCKGSGPGDDEVNPIGAKKPTAKKVVAAPKAPEPPKEDVKGGDTENPDAKKPQTTPEPAPLNAKIEMPQTPELPIDESKLDVVVAHMGSVVDILEKNSGDPGKAAAALDEYLQTNKKSVVAWRQEMEALKEKLTPEQQQLLGVKLLGRLGPVMQKLQALNEAHPELFSDPKVKEVWGQLQ